MLCKIEEPAAPPRGHEAPPVVHAAELWLHPVRPGGMDSMLSSNASFCIKVVRGWQFNRLWKSRANSQAIILTFWAHSIAIWAVYIYDLIFSTWHSGQNWGQFLGQNSGQQKVYWIATRYLMWGITRDRRAIILAISMKTIYQSHPLWKSDKDCFNSI